MLDDGPRPCSPTRTCCSRSASAPSTLVVGYDDVDDASAALPVVAGSLTATVHAEPGEDVADDPRRAHRDRRSRALRGLADRCRRELGAAARRSVAVDDVAPHVGRRDAIRRFLRPVAYQDAAGAALPAELREANPLGIPRRVDGVLRLPGTPAD